MLIAKIVTVISLSIFTGCFTEIKKIGPALLGDPIVISRAKMNALFELPPGGVEAAGVFIQFAIGLGIVSGREHNCLWKLGK